jgi:hypothetical protein
MKAIKNFEGLFLVAAALTIVATYASAQVPAARATKAQVINVATSDNGMPTVTVRAHRLSAAEKARFG